MKFPSSASSAYKEYKTAAECSAQRQKRGLIALSALAVILAVSTIAFAVLFFEAKEQSASALQRLEKIMNALPVSGPIPASDADVEYGSSSSSMMKKSDTTIIHEVENVLPNISGKKANLTTEPEPELPKESSSDTQEMAKDESKETDQISPKVNISETTAKYQDIAKSSNPYAPLTFPYSTLIVTEIPVAPLDFIELDTVLMHCQVIHGKQKMPAVFKAKGKAIVVDVKVKVGDIVAPNTELMTFRKIEEADLLDEKPFAVVEETEH